MIGGNGGGALKGHRHNQLDEPYRCADPGTRRPWDWAFVNARTGRKDRRYAHCGIKPGKWHMD
jgi:hypothetical protein